MIDKHEHTKSDARDLVTTRQHIVSGKSLQRDVPHPSTSPHAAVEEPKRGACERAQALYGDNHECDDSEDSEEYSFVERCATLC